MPREEKSNPIGSGADGGSSLAARRARLRGSLARTQFPEDEAPYTPAQVEEPKPEEPSVQEDTEVSQPSPTMQVAADETPAHFDPIAALGGGGPAVTAAAKPSTPIPTGNTPMPKASSSSTLTAATTPLPAIPDHALETLQNIDSALSACATNLAALQRLSEEQTDVLKGLTTTLQNQTLSEIGLNLNSLTESFSAALEPMKAIGELVPAMDQLVTTLEGREVDGTTERLSPDQLVTSLADQLSAGLIDPWTFKCAYMAIYPTEHPADLLHRLVELLGTQRLSGDLFRSAYEAVQGAEAPARAGGKKGRKTSSDSPEERLAAVDDEEIRARIEELQRTNEELMQRQEERERELTAQLLEKDQELQEAQELFNSRYDEFNSRYEEVADGLNKREEEYRDLLERKDMELVEKESELNLLRAQMEELRNQTEEMVKDLQKQLSDVKIAKEELANQQKQQAAAAASFFDPAPQNRGSFDPATGAQVPDKASQTMAAVQAAQPAPAQVTTQQPSVQAQPAPVPQAPAAGQAPPPGNPGAARQTQQQPQPAATTTPFNANSSGSYGSGVRAQVFEVIVRQALAGAPWREICAGPMQVNNISPDEVETEVKRRQALLNK